MQEKGRTTQDRGRSTRDDGWGFDQTGIKRCTSFRRESSEGLQLQFSSDQFSTVQYSSVEFSPFSFAGVGVYVQIEIRGRWDGTVRSRSTDDKHARALTTIRVQFFLCEGGEVSTGQDRSGPDRTGQLIMTQPRQK